MLFILTIKFLNSPPFFPRTGLPRCLALAKLGSRSTQRDPGGRTPPQHYIEDAENSRPRACGLVAGLMWGLFFRRRRCAPKTIEPKSASAGADARPSRNGARSDPSRAPLGFPESNVQSASGLGSRAPAQPWDTTTRSRARKSFTADCQPAAPSNSPPRPDTKYFRLAPTNPGAPK